jgi:Uncharacterised protein family (UPF0175)
VRLEATLEILENIKIIRDLLEPIPARGCEFWYQVRLIPTLRGSPMTISFEIPRDLEEDVAANGADLNDEAREAFLVELYRQHRISQHQLGTALGLDDYDTDGVLKRHGIALERSIEEQRAEAESLEEARPA